MTVDPYMEHHVSRAITAGLRLRDVDVLTAAEDGAATIPDPDLLDRAGEIGRVIFTQDADLLREATHRLNEGIPFCGVIYAHQLYVPIGVCVRDLEMIAKATDPDDLRDQVTHLPL